MEAIADLLIAQRIYVDTIAHALAKSGIVSIEDFTNDLEKTNTGLSGTSNYHVEETIDRLRKHLS